jgi:tetratricopeptide (TPR) repeat protein
MGQLLTLVIVLCALGLGTWMFIKAIGRSPNARTLTIKWIATAIGVFLWFLTGLILGPVGAPIMPGLAVGFGIIISIMWTPHIAAVMSSPITNWYDGGDQEPELKPLYSMAQAYRNRGQYDRAIAEIHKQLARFPEDYQGYMMLAEVQADNVGDLDAALRTIDGVLSLPELPPKNVAFALSQAADWQVKYRSDLDAARECFQRIMDRLPDTVEAQLAAQRIAHLGSAADLADRNEPRVMALKHHDERIGLLGRAVEAPVEESITQRAQRFVDQLRDHPLDNDARENLALLYANEYERLDLAAAQLEELIARPHQLPKNVVHWLNLLADFQIKLAGDVEAARATLERIGTLYPNGAAANNARVRLSQLRLELNQLSKQKTLKMGEYEQNIGLKKMNSAGTVE